MTDRIEELIIELLKVSDKRTDLIEQRIDIISERIDVLNNYLDLLLLHKDGSSHHPATEPKGHSTSECIKKGCKI